MKRIVVTLLVIMTVMHWQILAKKIITPDSLKTGDKIMILSPSGSVDSKYVDDAVVVLQEWGYEPIVSDYCKGKEGTYSGTQDQRLQDLKSAFENPEVKAILCSRGGYGAVHLTEFLPAEFLRKHPKWVIGYSDISVLHAMMVSAGVKSIHSPMTSHLSKMNGADSCSVALKDILVGKLPTYHVEPHEFNHYGTVKGELVGGNLAVLAGLVSTDVDIVKKDKILFIEDIEEPVYKLERMLYTLRLNGVLGSLKGLIVGQFTNCNPGKNNESIYEVINRLTKDYDFPIAFNFPVGHVDINYPMIEGAEVELNVQENGTSLKFIE